MFLLPGSSWLRLAIALAAVIIISTLLLQQLNISVRFLDQQRKMSSQYSTIRSEVEMLEQSLLDCTASKSSMKEVATMSSAEKCMYEYELTLSFQATMGR